MALSSCLAGSDCLPHPTVSTMNTRPELSTKIPDSEPAATLTRQLIALRAENERLRAELVGMMGEAVQVTDALSTALAENERLRALNEQLRQQGFAEAETSERLRAALTEVASYGHRADCSAGVSDKYRCWCGYIDVLEALGRHD